MDKKKLEQINKIRKKLATNIIFLAILAAVVAFIISFGVYKMPSTSIDSIDSNFVVNGTYTRQPFNINITGGSSESIIVKPFNDFSNLENPAIYFDTDLFWNVIYDGNSIASFSPKDVKVGSTIGDRMNIVSLPAKYSGEEIVIIFYAPDNITSGKAPTNIYLSSYDEIFGEIIRNYIPILVMISIITILSIIYIAIDELALKKVSYTHLLTMLGVSSILISLWVLTQNTITGLIFGYNYFFTATQYFSFVLMQGFILVFFKQYPTWEKAQSNVVIPAIFAGLGILYVILNAVGALSFTVTYNFSMLSLILIIIEIIVSCIRYATTNINLSGDSAVMFFGNLMMSILGIVDLYRSLADGDPDHSACTRIGLLIYVICVGLYQIYSILTYLRAAEEKKAVQKLAFFDALTGIENRMAFNERIDELEKSRVDHPEVTYNPGIIIFDLNNLKKANDIYGHTEGDALIKTAGQTIDAVFSEVGTAYRYGGDEFVVVIESFYEDFVKQYLKKLSDREAVINNKAMFQVPFAIAYGYAAFDAEKDKDLMQTLDRADEIMYVNKQAMKAKARAAAGETGPAPVDDRLL